jgi:hypothetical protein
VGAAGRVVARVARAPAALEGVLDQEAGRPYQEVEREAAVRKGGAEGERADEEEEDVEREGDDVGEVEAGGVARGEELGGFLEGGW